MQTVLSCINGNTIIQSVELKRDEALAMLSDPDFLMGYEPISQMRSVINQDLIHCLIFVMVPMASDRPFISDASKKTRSTNSNDQQLG